MILGVSNTNVYAFQLCLWFLAPLSFSHLWQHDIQVKSIINITYPNFCCYAALASEESSLYLQLQHAWVFGLS